MNKKVIVIGAGGHGKVVAEIIALSGDEILGFLDDKKVESFDGFPILGTTQDIGKWDCWYFPAVGNNHLREQLMSIPVRWYTAIHPSAVVSARSAVKEGTVIAAGAVVNPCSVIGRGVIINTAASIDHDNVICDFAHISPGAHLAGTVEIGKRCWIGLGASIINNVLICDNTVVGAGSVVLHTIEHAGTYVGVPARAVVSGE